MSRKRLVTPPQMLRASSQRAYDVLVRNTSKRDNAKLVELKAAGSSKVMPCQPMGSKLVCVTTENSKLLHGQNKSHCSQQPCYMNWLWLTSRSVSYAATAAAIAVRIASGCRSPRTIRLYTPTVV